MLSAFLNRFCRRFYISGASCFAAVISVRSTNSGGLSSFLGSEYCFLFFTILVFSAVDNYFIKEFDPQAVVFAFVGYLNEGGCDSGSVTSCFFLFICCWSVLCARVGGKTESALRPLPRSFEVPSLGDFVAGMPEDLLRCPVCAFSEYLDRTSGIVNRPRRLFISSKCPSRAISKNDISYMLRAFFIPSSASSRSGQVPRAPSIGGIATSSAFFLTCSGGGGGVILVCFPQQLA